MDNFSADMVSLEETRKTFQQYWLNSIHEKPCFKKGVDIAVAI